MPQLTTISGTQTNTQIVDDVPSPTLQEHRASLQKALEQQNEHEINRLLNAIRRDPHADMAGVVGEFYFKADESQQLAMDIWSEHLSSDQRFMFEDARSMGFSKLLKVALEQRHDRLLDVLLKGARELDHSRLLGLVGMHYSDASPDHKEAIDKWRAGLTDQQNKEASSPGINLPPITQGVLPLLNGQDLLHMTMASKGLQTIIKNQPDLQMRIYEHKISAVFDTVFSWEWPQRLNMLLSDLSQQDEPFQERVLNRLIDTLSTLDISDDQGMGETVLKFINEMKTMTARAELLEKISRHWEAFITKTKEAEKHELERIWEGFMPRFMDSLALLDPPSLKVPALYNVSIVKLQMMDGYSWGLLRDFPRTTPLDGVPSSLLQPWIGFLRQFGDPYDFQLFRDLRTTIEARYPNESDLTLRLETLSLLVNLGVSSDEKNALVNDILIPALVPGQPRDVVFGELANHVIATLNADHLNALQLYVNDATGKRSTELAVKFSKSLRRHFSSSNYRESIDPRTYARFFTASVDLLTRLPAPERLKLASNTASMLESAIFLNWPCQDGIRELDSREQRHILSQLEEASHDLPVDGHLEYIQGMLQRIREHLHGDFL